MILTFIVIPSVQKNVFLVNPLMTQSHGDGWDLWMCIHMGHGQYLLCSSKTSMFAECIIIFLAVSWYPYSYYPYFLHILSIFIDGVQVFPIYLHILSIYIGVQVFPIYLHILSIRFSHGIIAFDPSTVPLRKHGWPPVPSPARQRWRPPPGFASDVHSSHWFCYITSS